MRIFLGIMTCPAHADRDEALRDSWLPWVKQLNDNVETGFIHHTPEGRHNLASKFYKLVSMVLYQGFDALISADNDTFFMPLARNVADITRFDYCGHVRSMTHPFAKRNGAPYAHGSLFSLSRHAMRAILDCPDVFSHGVHDTAVGRALMLARIFPVHDERIKLDTKDGQPLPSNELISTHFVTPERMRLLASINRGRI